MEAVVATYKGGVLTPSRPLALVEGQEVIVWVDPNAEQRERLTDQDREYLRNLTNERAEVFRRLAE